MPPTLMDRGSEQDQMRYWRNSHELDQVASWILATVWSGGNPQGKGAQVGNIGLRTVAVACLSNQSLLVASNAVSFDAFKITFNPKNMNGNPNWYYKLSGFRKDDIAFEPKMEVRKVLSDLYKSVEFPQECQNGFNFHAEMALLQYMSQKNLHPDPRFIGVSKPCCKYCRMMLKGAGIDHSFYHTDAVGEWQEPTVVSTWKA
jgi:hypothetical protein